MFPDAPVARDGNRYGADGAFDTRPVDLIAVALSPCSAVNREHRRAPGLRGACDHLDVARMVESSADLGGDGNAPFGSAHGGRDGRFEASRLPQGRGAGASAERAACRATEVQVEYRHAELRDVARRALHAAEISAHELDADGNRKAVQAEVLGELLWGDRAVDDPNELRERAAELLGGVSPEHQVAERRGGDSLHRGEQGACREREAGHDRGRALQSGWLARECHGPKSRLPSMWLNERLLSSGGTPADWGDLFPEINVTAALKRVAPSVRRTPTVRLPFGSHELYGKLECLQETGSFKARGAFNNLALLSKEERERGVVASSSGNHGRALAWAAKASGVAATIVMPKNAYPNKIEACRAEGAEVVLAEDRVLADEIAAKLADPEGDSRLVWIHPYDRSGTIEGAGTVGLELLEDMSNQVDVVIMCVGGGGLSAGSSLALRRALGTGVVLFGAEPTGAAAMTEALRKGESVRLETITSEVQGLTTPYAGHRNVEICGATLDGTITLDDEAIFAAQALLVRPDEALGWKGEVVEPAGAAALAAALDPSFEDRVNAVYEARGGRPQGGKPLRVGVTISGGNPAPAQLAAIRAR